MKARTFLLFLFLLGSAAWAGAPQGVLPASFGGWTGSAAQTESAPANLEKIAGEKAAVLREYGIASAEQGGYARGAEQATVTLYRMADPSAAFGAFTYLRDPKMTPLAAGEPAAYAAGTPKRALLVVGNIVLDVGGSSERPSTQDLKLLAAALAPQASHAPYPTIGGFLPQNGLVPDSAHYVLGTKAFAQAFPVGAAGAQDWIGFDKNAEATIARYRLGSKTRELLLLIALYPTQQVAAEKYRDLDAWVALNADADAKDGRPHIFGKRSGALVALVAGADSRESASGLLEKIEYTSQVTWNEPAHSLTDPGIGAMIAGAIMGTGAIMLMAIAAGIGFGGFRLFVKFLFPGRIFDRSEHLEILQLGLSSKPIEAKDFYMLDSSGKP